MKDDYKDLDNLKTNVQYLLGSGHYEDSNLPTGRREDLKSPTGLNSPSKSLGFLIQDENQKLRGHLEQVQEEEIEGGESRFR